MWDNGKQFFSISLGSAPSFSRRAESKMRRHERRSAPKAKAWRSFFCFVFSLRKDSQRLNEILSFWDQSRRSGLLPFPSSYYLLQTLAPTVRLVSTLSSLSLYTARLSTASMTSSSSLLGGGMNSRMKLNPETIIDFEDLNRALGSVRLLRRCSRNPSLVLSLVPCEVKPNIKRYPEWANKPRINTEIVDQWKIAS